MAAITCVDLRTTKPVGENGGSITCTETWRTLIEFGTGWSQAVSYPSRYRKLPDGCVIVQLNVTADLTAAPDALIAQLPSGYLPDSPTILEHEHGVTSGVPFTHTVEIDPHGVIQFTGGDGSSSYTVALTAIYFAEG